MGEEPDSSFLPVNRCGWWELCGLSLCRLPQQRREPSSQGLHAPWPSAWMPLSRLCSSLRVASMCQRQCDHSLSPSTEGWPQSWRHFALGQTAWILLELTQPWVSWMSPTGFAHPGLFGLFLPIVGCFLPLPAVSCIHSQCIGYVLALPGNFV